jgi:hypothetical protein
LAVPRMRTIRRVSSVVRARFSVIMMRPSARSSSPPARRPSQFRLPTRSGFLEYRLEMAAHRRVFDTECIRGGLQRISCHQAKNEARLRGCQIEPALEKCHLRHSRSLQGIDPCVHRCTLRPNGRGKWVQYSRDACHPHPAGRVQCGSGRYAGGAARTGARVMSTMHFSCNNHGRYRSPQPPPRSWARAVTDSTQVPPAK